MEYHWYSAVSESVLQQGDFLDDYELYYGYDKATKDILVDRFDLIVMSQSCDLIKASSSHVVLCQVLSLDKAAKIWPAIGHKKEKERLRQGRYLHFHLLNECHLAGFERPFSIVNFQRIFEAPKEDVLSFIASKQRLRLLPPYREHLSQAFARFFMRVGLPADIPPFK